MKFLRTFSLFALIPIFLLVAFFCFNDKVDAINTGDYPGVIVTNGTTDCSDTNLSANRLVEDCQNLDNGGGGGGSTTTTKYTLYTSVATGPSTGSISWTPFGFLDGCNTSCSVQKASGAAITLNANPNSGYVFIGWGGDCASYGTAVCHLTMNSNKTVSASFGNPSESVNKSSVIVYVAEVPGPTGIITAEKEGCLIDEGNNTCDIRFDWQTNNPVGTSSVTRSPESGFTIQNANSGENVSLPVTYGGSTFYLYNDGIELSKVAVNAANVECISGTTWVSSQNKCIKDVSVKSFSTPSCQIEIGKSSCTSEISWEVTGGYGDFSVTTPVNQLVDSERVGSKTWLIEYPSRDFYLYNNSKEISKSTSYADCVSGSSWSTLEKKCVPIIEIPPCPPRTTWNEASQACLCDNGASNPPDCTDVPHECLAGTTWNETAQACLCDNGASNPPVCNLFGTLSKFEVKDCSIKSNESTCQTKLNWTSTLLGTFAITTPEQITVSTASSGTDVPYTVEYPSRKFFAYNNSNLVEEKIAYAKCEDGSIWSTVENKCVDTPIIPHECPVGTNWSELSQACLCNNGATNPPECNLFGTLSKFEVKDCSIKSNESSCQTKLNWTSTLLGSFAITTPEQITVSTASSGTDVPYTVEYPSRKFFAYNNGNLVEEKVAYAKCEDGSIWSTGENKCVPAILCGGDSERDVYFDCPLGYEGKIIRKQFKTYPECTFPEPVTEENSILINNNCKPKGDNPDPQWTRTCDECTEGVAQVRCVETNEKGDVRDFVMNCPGDTDGNGGGSGNSVLNITLKATPEKIMKGRLSTITWSSSADSCRAIPVPGYRDDFYTGEKNRPSGFDTVKPLSNNIYKIECTKGEITESKTVEVKVGSVNIIEM